MPGRPTALVEALDVDRDAHARRGAVEDQCRGLAAGQRRDLLGSIQGDTEGRRTLLGNIGHGDGQGLSAYGAEIVGGRDDEAVDVAPRWRPAAFEVRREMKRSASLGSIANSA